MQSATDTLFRDAILAEQQVTCTYGGNAYELPGTPPEFILADRNPVPAPGAKPDPKAVKVLFEREYTGFELPDMAR